MRRTRKSIRACIRAYTYVYCDNKACMCHVSYGRRLLYELAEVQRRYCLRNETRYVKQRRCYRASHGKPAAAAAAACADHISSYLVTI